jgi:hypothetical protein
VPQEARQKLWSGSGSKFGLACGWMCQGLPGTARDCLACLDCLLGIACDPCAADYAQEKWGSALMQDSVAVCAVFYQDSIFVCIRNVLDLVDLSTGSSLSLALHDLVDL